MENMVPTRQLESITDDENDCETTFNTEFAKRCCIEQNVVKRKHTDRPKKGMKAFGQKINMIYFKECATKSNVNYCFHQQKSEQGHSWLKRNSPGLWMTGWKCYSVLNRICSGEGDDDGVFVWYRSSQTYQYDCEKKTGAFRKRIGDGSY